MPTTRTTRRIVAVFNTRFIERHYTQERCRGGSLDAMFRAMSCDFVDRALMPPDDDPRNHTNRHENAPVHETVCNGIRVNHQPARRSISECARGRTCPARLQRFVSKSAHKIAHTSESPPRHPRVPGAKYR